MASIQQQKNNAITELPVGGSVNQVLAKATSADYDVAWQTITAPVTYVGTAGIVVEGNIIRLDSTALAQYELPTATTTTLGAVKVGNNLTIDDGVLRAIIPDSVATTHNNGLMSNTDKIKLDDISVGANNYELPIATAEDLGGVKIGSGIDITNGVISVKKATDSVLGLVKAGTNITIDTNGVISAISTPYLPATTETPGLMSAADKARLDAIAIPAAYTHPTYTPSSGDNTGLYKVKVDDTGHVCTLSSVTLADLHTLGVITDLATTETNGLLSAEDKSVLDSIADGTYGYSLPIATTSVLGGVKVGTGLSINVDGTLAVDNATSSSLGCVKPDGRTITVNEQGVISTLPPIIAPADNSTAGLLSAADYTLLQALITESDEYLTEIPTATASDLGGIKIGDGLEVSSGVVSVPTATNAVTGIVKPDGTTITINDGVISATNAGTTYTAGSGITITNSIISSNIAFAVYPLGDDDAQIQLLRSGDAASYFNLKAGNNIQLEVTNDGSQRDITITSNHGHAYQELSGIIASNAIPVDNITVKRNTNNPSTIYVPTATGALLGLVKPDNNTITIDENGVISATAINETEYALTAIPDPAGVYIKINDDDDAPITLVAGDNITLTANDNVVTIASTATTETPAATTQYALTATGSGADAIVRINDNDTPLTLVAGDNITLTTSNNTITIASTASGDGGEGTVIGGDGGSSITVDQNLNVSSDNPVRNSVIYSQFSIVNEQLTKLATCFDNIGVSVDLTGGTPYDTTINASAIPYDYNTLGINENGELYATANVPLVAGQGITLIDNWNNGRIEKTVACDLRLKCYHSTDYAEILLETTSEYNLPAAFKLVAGNNITFSTETSNTTEGSISYMKPTITINAEIPTQLTFNEGAVLTDVANEDVLIYDMETSNWVNKPISTYRLSIGQPDGTTIKTTDNVLSATLAVKDLTDVEIGSLTVDDVGKVFTVVYNTGNSAATWGLVAPTAYTSGLGISLINNQISVDNTELEFFCELESQITVNSSSGSAKKLQYIDGAWSIDSSSTIDVIASPLLGSTTLEIGTLIHVRWFSSLSAYVIIGFEC